MTLKNKKITILLIVLSFMFFLLFSFTFISKIKFNKTNIKESFNSFNYKKYIKDNAHINDLIGSYIIPNKVFDYIDANEVKEVVNNSINKMYNNDDIIILENDVYNLLINAVNKYDEIYLSFLGSNINRDIVDYSRNVYTDINDEDCLNTYRWIVSMGNNFALFFFVIVIILLFIVLIILEKWNGFFLSGAMFVINSIIMYYIDCNFVDLFLKKINILKYVEISNNNFVNINVTIFLIGIVLLLIYVIYLIKRLLYKIRLYSYDKKYWR